MAQALTKKSLTRSLALICNAIGSSPIRNPNSLSKFLSYRAPDYKEIGVKKFHVRGEGHIAEDMPMEYALGCGNGIGRSRAHMIASQLGITNKHGRDMSLNERDTIRDGSYSNHLLEHDLGRVVDHDIARLKDIHCYSGARQEDKLPYRGQRTCTNARTLRDVHLCSKEKEKKMRERMRRQGYLVY